MNARTTTALVALGLTALAGPAAADKASDTLNIAFDQELDTLNVYLNSSREGILFSRTVFDALVYRDPETSEYLPNLATAWEWIDDTTLEVQLREGVTFHDGEPFDADDVVYTIEWVADEANGANPQRNVSWLAGAEKIDATTVRLLLDEPFPAALEYLAGPVVMLPNEYYEKVGPVEFGRAPIGTGPYRVTQVEPGKRFELERREGYHEDSPKGEPSIGSIVIRTLPDRNTQIAELLSGGIDWLWRISPDQAERLDSMGRFTVERADSMRINWMTFDVSGRSGENPFQDVRVREAVAHAIDRESILDNVVGEPAQIVNAACYPTQFGCSDEGTRRFDYDPDRARQLLAEAGYPDGFETPMYAYRERDQAESIIGYLSAVGIRPSLQFMKYAALLDEVKNDKVPFAFRSWGSFSINDTSAITGTFFKSGWENITGDDEVAAWLESADSSIDPDVRRENYLKALQKISEEVYWFPLWSDPRDLRLQRRARVHADGRRDPALLHDELEVMRFSKRIGSSRIASAFGPSASSTEH